MAMQEESRRKERPQLLGMPATLKKMTRNPHPGTAATGYAMRFRFTAQMFFLLL